LKSAVSVPVDVKFRLHHCVRAGIGIHAAYFPVDTAGAGFSFTVQHCLCLTRQNVRVMKLHIHRHLSSKLRVRGTHAHARSEAIGKTDNCTYVFSVTILHNVLL